jgi:hypothetical protein
MKRVYVYLSLSIIVYLFFGCQKDEFVEEVMPTNTISANHLQILENGNMLKFDSISNDIPVTKPDEFESMYDVYLNLKIGRAHV